jgi:hypothetical protein
VAKFSKGARIVHDDGTTLDIEGVEFELRELTNLVRIQAARMVKRLDSDEVIETVRASFKTFRGAKVTDDFPEYSAMNARAMSDVNKEFNEVNGDGPLLPGKS